MDLTLLCPAKINLFLNVMQKNLDNFHPIQSLFTTISLFDQLEVSIIKSSKLKIILENSVCAVNPKNDIIYKSVKLFSKNTGIKFLIKIKLIKNIPVGGGLGGGSSDAACILKTLNDIYGHPLSYNDLASIAFKLGSDVPYFLYAGMALVHGVGDKIINLYTNNNFKILLISNLKNSATEKVYACYDRLNVFSLPLDDINLNKIISVFKSNDISDMFNYIKNDLETPFLNLYPAQAKFKSDMEKLLGLKLFVSGSGATFFSPITYEQSVKIKSNKSLLNKKIWIKLVDTIM